jgi:hypothetical protein
LRVTLNGAEAPTQIDLAGETPYVAVPVEGGEASIRIEW